MRWSGGFLVAALLAAGFALYLTGRDALTSIDAVSAVADGLREDREGSSGLDPSSAEQMITAMESLLEAPETIGESIDDLRTFADTAASWAAAAPVASRELHVAVSLRGAAGDLRAHALNPSPTHLMRARRRLSSARSTLSSWRSGDEPTEPVLVTDGLRDQIQNLEQSHREQQQEVDEAIQQ
jgi:hypothetical protein